MLFKESSEAAPRPDQGKRRAASLAEAFLTTVLKTNAVPAEMQRCPNAERTCGRGAVSVSRMRHVSRTVLPAGVLFLLVASVPVHAQVFEALGVRALGMGGAFVAVADDATANYWNPAGLTNVVSSAVLEVQQLETRVGLDPTLREGTRDHTTFASLAGPFVGLSYYRLRSWQVDRVTGDGVDGDTTAALTSLVTHHAGFTVVQPFGPSLAVATVMKAVRGTVAVGSGDGGAAVEDLFDQTSQLSGRATTRFDLDAGVMLSVGAVRVGLVGRNLREPEFAVSDDAGVSLRRQVRAGFSVRPTGSLVVAVDVDLSIMTTVAGPRRTIAVGAEQQLGRLVVRAGGRVNVEDNDPEPVLAFGLSLEVLSGFFLDGQMTGGGDDGDRGWGVSTRIGG